MALFSRRLFTRAQETWSSLNDAMRQYYFNPRFTADILSGKKTMTIRRVWKKPVRKGERLCLHVDVPSRGETIAIKAYCSDAFPVQVSNESITVRKRKLGRSEIPSFLRNDGFRSFSDMISFFEHRYSLPFSGQCICWNVERHSRSKR